MDSAFPTSSSNGKQQEENSDVEMVSEEKIENRNAIPEKSTISAPSGDEDDDGPADASNPVSAPVTTESINDSAQLESLDGVILECMEKLGTRLTVLESELQYAWKALDLLSQEYVIMWNRMEKAEILLTQQQAIISKMIEEQADESEEARKLFLSSQQRKKKDDDGENGSGPGGGPGGTGGGNNFSPYTSSSSSFSRGGGHETRATRTPDEAFYRSLNLAHQGNEEPELVTEQELSLIWEEDASDIGEKVSSTSPPGATEPSRKEISTGGDGGERETDKVIGSNIEVKSRLLFNEDSFEVVESSGGGGGENVIEDEDEDEEEENYQVDRKVRKVDTRDEEEEPRRIFSALDYKDYRRESKGSPTISEKDLKDLEELSAISSLETRDIIDNLDRHVGGKVHQFQHHHHQHHHPHKIPTSKVDSSHTTTTTKSPVQSPVKSSTSSAAVGNGNKSLYESPQRRIKATRQQQRERQRSALEESFRQLYADLDIPDDTPSTATTSSKLRSSPIPMDIGSDRSSSALSSNRPMSPSSRQTSSLNDFILNQELLIRDALRDNVSGTTSPYQHGSQHSESEPNTDQEVNAALLGTNYDPLGRIVSSSPYATIPYSTAPPRYSNSPSFFSPEVNGGASNTDRVTGNASPIPPSRTRQDGYIGGSTSPYMMSVASPARSPRHGEDSRLSAHHEEYMSSPKSPKRVSPMTSLYFSDQSQQPFTGGESTPTRDRYPDSHDILVQEGTAAALQMATRVHIASPVPEYSTMNDLSVAGSQVVRRTPTGLETNLGDGGIQDSINIRPSPKSPKPSKASLIHARSDSGVSEMSNWSSLEKSPTSPSRYATSAPPPSYSSSLHGNLPHHTLQSLSLSPGTGSHIHGHGTISPRHMTTHPDFDSSKETSIVGGGLTAVVVGDGMMPDVTIATSLPPGGGDQPMVFSTSPRDRGLPLPPPPSYQVSDKDNEILPDLTTTSSHLSPRSSRIMGRVSPSLSGKVYDVQTDMDFQRQDMVAMALARDRDRERDLITGSVASPSSSATIGLDSLYKSAGYTSSSCQVAPGGDGPPSQPPTGRESPYLERNRWGTAERAGYVGRDMSTKPTRPPYLAGSDSDDSGDLYSYRESSHYHTRVKHAAPQSVTYSAYDPTHSSGRHHYSPSTYEIEREREFLDREMMRRGRAMYSSNQKNFYAPSVPSTYYAASSKYGCYENPSYTVTEPGELKWPQKEDPTGQPYHQGVHRHARAPEAEQQQLQYMTSMRGSLINEQGLPQQNFMGQQMMVEGGKFDNNFSYRPDQPLHLQQRIGPYGVGGAQLVSNQSQYGAVGSGQVPGAQQPGGYDLRQQYYAAQQQAQGAGYLQSRAGYVSISSERAGSGTPSDNQDASQSTLNKRGKPKRTASLKSAMHSVGKMAHRVQQDLHLTLPKKERSRSLSDSEKPDIQKQYGRQLPPPAYSSSASSTPAGTMKKKKRHSMSIVTNIATLVHKAKKWGSQSEDSDLSESEHQYRGGYYRPKGVDTSPRGRYLGVKPGVGRGAAGRSYEASESDLSESNLFPKVKSARRTMSEGSGTETDIELDRLPDLAQELFPTIGEVKKPQPTGGESGGGGSGGSGSGSQRSSMNLEKHQTGSPLISPTSGEGGKFATMGTSSGMEFAASRAVGKYRQRQAATNGATINNRQSQFQRADSLPPPRPPPPQRGASFDGKSVVNPELQTSSIGAQSETTLAGDDDTESIINYQTQLPIIGVGGDDDDPFVSQSIDQSKTGSPPTMEEQVFHKTKLDEVGKEFGGERRESDGTEIFKQIGMTFPASDISSPPTEQYPYGTNGTTPVMATITTTLPSELLIPMGASPVSTHSPSPSGLTSSFPTIRTSPQSSARFGLQHQSSLSNKSFGDSDMGSSSDSARLSLSSKNRLDLPSQRTLSEEEDTRSTHSMRSSRVSSRRQSTEESLDEDDEWYKYELRKLEELEKQQMAAIESQPTSISNIPQTQQLRFQQYTYVNAMGVHAYSPSQAPMSATADMKERMNIVLQELLLKTSPEPDGGKHGPDSVPQSEEISPSSGQMERRLSLTKSQRQSLHRDEVDEPLGYVSRRRRTNSHEDYEPDQESESGSSIWKQSEHHGKERSDSGRGSIDFGSMIEPPPVEIGLRIGIAIESSKKAQQHQDSSSVKSSESAFYSGGDQTRDTITGEDRPSISLPSSSSIGDNVWHSERKDEEEEESHHKKEKAHGGTSSGDTSGPDTPQESFDEDEMQIAKEEEMIRKHLKLGKEQDPKEQEEGELTEGEEERESTKQEGSETGESGERKYSVESQLPPPEERKNSSGEICEGEGAGYYDTEQELDDTFHDNLPPQAPGLAGSGPGTGTGTPTSRRESTQSMGLSISRKFMDMFSMGELKKLTTSDGDEEGGDDERNKVKGDSTSGSPPDAQQQSAQEEGEISAEHGNKMSAMSMSVDDDSMAEGGGPLGSKWGFLKTLKEKKAEEKTNAAAVAQLQADILVIFSQLRALHFIFRK